LRQKCPREGLAGGGGFALDLRMFRRGRWDDGFCALASRAFDDGLDDDCLPSDQDAHRLRSPQRESRQRELRHMTRAVDGYDAGFDAALNRHLDPLVDVEDVNPRKSALEWVGREMENISWQITLDSRPSKVSTQPSAKHGEHTSTEESEFIPRSSVATRSSLHKLLSSVSRCCRMSRAAPARGQRRLPTFSVDVIDAASAEPALTRGRLNEAPRPEAKRHLRHPWLCLFRFGPCCMRCDDGFGVG